MLRQLLKSKIHRAKVTCADLHYEGSITIDRDLMAAADIVPHEHVHVWNVTSGNRFETYAICGEKGVIQVNGAAAHLARQDDLVIISSFATVPEEKISRHHPKVVHVDPKDNSIMQVTAASGNAQAT